MEVFTILKKDIKKKKGIFICIALLSTLIIASFLSIFGVKSEYNRGMKKLIKDTHAPNIFSYRYDTYYDPVLKGKIEAVEGVESVFEGEALTSINNNHQIKYSDGTLSGIKDRNTYLLEKFSVEKDNFKLINDKVTGYVENIPELKKGEIYLPYGLKDKLHCNVGDYYVDEFGLEMYEEDGETKYRSTEYEFLIKGFVATPTFGANPIGWKEIFISDADYEEIREISVIGGEIIRDNNLSTAYNFSLVNVVYKIFSDNSISDNKLAKKINLETGLQDKAIGTITLSQSKNYTGIYITIISGVLIGFVGILLAVVLIVISSSVSGDIESDYKKLGILKALGFSNKKIGLIIALLYLLSELVGLILGVIISIFLKGYLGKLFIPITAVIPSHSLSIVNVIIITLIMGLSSVLFIFVKLLKLRRITPIKAINGGNSDIYFSPRIKAPLTKRALSASISLKQVLSSPLRYLSIVLIMAVLSLFMLTSIRMSNLTRSKNIGKTMGMSGATSINLSTYTEYPLTYEMIDEIVSAANKHSKVNYYNAVTSSYISIDGDQTYLNAWMSPENLLGVYKGRAPIYDNEFVTTKIICDTYDLKIGDKVVLSSKDGSAEFVLTGIYQCLNDTGNNISLSYEGLKRIDSNQKVYFMELEIEDDTKVDAVLEELKNISANRFKVKDNREFMDEDMAEYSLICDAICIVILVFAVIFSLVTIRLLTVKTFIQERIDLGIYKANGFRTRTLRHSMALRFVIASALGLLIGMVLAILFANDILGMLLYQMGLVKIKVDNKVIDYILVIFGGMILAYLGAYIASRRIKKVSIRELVVE